MSAQMSLPDKSLHRARRNRGGLDNGRRQRAAATVGPAAPVNNQPLAGLPVPCSGRDAALAG